MLDIYGIISLSTRLEELLSIQLIMDELLDFCDPLIYCNAMKVLQNSMNNSILCNYLPQNLF